MNRYERLRRTLNAVGFASGLGFTPDDKQALVLESLSRRMLLCCSRQWGKSTVTALAAVQHAYCVAQSEILVVSPSGRQPSWRMSAN